MRKMENKRISVGDMEAQGEQMSKKRAQENGGEDPLRRKNTLMTGVKNAKERNTQKTQRGVKSTNTHFKSSE